jgi:UDP-GlcNAc:undecaprenyl-phosphate GlcNAc-1-phosphate transferase
VNLISTALLALLCTVIAVLALRPIAITLDLVDRPGGRKTHQGEVPLVGGLAMFLGLAIALGLAHPANLRMLPVLSACGLMVIIGLLDDRYGLPHWMRLVVHLVAGATLVLTTHAMVRTLGDPFGMGVILLPAWGAALFSMAMITGAVNSFNMLDGMDGLASVNSLASIAGLAWLASQAGSGGFVVEFGVILAAAIAGFMLFNAPIPANRQVRCFMGDAGSTLIGVAVAWLCVEMSQLRLGDGLAHPSYVLWMVALPLFELWWTFLRRIFSGYSPFHADRGHFHHMLTDAGLSVRGAFLAFLMLNVLLVGTGMLLVALKVPDWVAFFGLILAGAVVVRTMYEAPRLVAMMPSLRRNRRAATSQTDA